MPNIKGGLNLLKRALDPVQDKALPLRLPRARLAPEYIDQQADRVARQMLGEHVVSGKPKETFNLAGRSKKESDRVKNLEYKLKPVGTVAQETPYAPRKGDINVAVPGDQTISDTILESIEGTPIGSVQQGGARYGLGQKHLDEPEFWKSNEAPAKSIQGKVDRLQEMYEPERMIGSHLAMGQTANNFAMHFADANLRAIDWSKASPKKINVFDNIIAGGYKDNKTGERVFFPNWPGLADPDAAMLAMKEDSNLRKWFNNRMKVPSITKPLDLPNGLDIQYAITEPNIRDLEINMTGLMTGKLKPGALVEAAGNPHNTYTHRILGEAEGAQEVLTPFQISHPDAAAHIASTKRPSDFTGTIQKVFPHQLVDEQYLDDYGRYRERIKKLTGKKDGGSVDIKSDGDFNSKVGKLIEKHHFDKKVHGLIENHMAGGGAVTVHPRVHEILNAPSLPKLGVGGLLKGIAKKGAAPIESQAAKQTRIALMPTARIGLEAPGILIPSKMNNVREAVRNMKGNYGARRVERAADEIPNLERMYKEDALKEAFTGDNASAMMTMHPADFERYAIPLDKRVNIDPKMQKLAQQGDIDKMTVPTDEYIKHLQRLQDGFDDVPYLNLFKDEVGLPVNPSVIGHEGRHRSRALADMGESSSLVKINPRGDLREGMPRRTQDDFIEALMEELEKSGRLVLPEVDGSYRRPPVKLPDIYATGGTVQHFDGGGVAHMDKGGDPLDEFSPPRYRSAGRRPESQNDRKASANMPVNLAGNIVAGVLGVPGRLSDIKKNAKEMYEEAKQSELANSPRARAQLAKIMAATSMGSIPDMVSAVAPFINSDAMLSAFPMQRIAKIGVTGTPSLGRRESVLSDETVPYSLADYTDDKDGDAIGGTEYLIKKQREAGKMYGGKKMVYDYEKSDKPKITLTPEEYEEYLNSEDRNRINLGGRLEEETGRFHPALEMGLPALAGAAGTQLSKSAIKAAERLGKEFTKGAKSKLTPIQANAKGGLSMASKVNFHPHRLTRSKL